MKKLISAASALAMAASMVGAAVPFATGAADASKGFELRAFKNKAGETVSTNISAEEIAAGDVTIPVGVYLTEATPDCECINAQWTIDSKDGGDASEVVFTGYLPGSDYFTVEQPAGEYSTTKMVTFSGTLTNNKKLGVLFSDTCKDSMYSVTEEQKFYGCENACGAIVWLKPIDVTNYNYTGSKSDDYPMFVFEATFPKGTPAGTYTIEFFDGADELGVPANFIEAGKPTKRLTKENGGLTVNTLDIVIGGDKQETQTTASSATTASSQGSTTTTASSSVSDIPNKSEFDIDPKFVITGQDYEVNPGDTVEVEFVVSNPEGRLGNLFVAELGDLPAGITAEMEDTFCYAVPNNREYSKIGETYQAKVMDPSTMDSVEITDGEVIICFTLTIPEDIEPGNYNYSLSAFDVVEHPLKTADHDISKFAATLKPGTITVKGEPSGTTTTKAPDTTTKAPDTTTKDAGTTTTKSTPVGDVLYGDTNCDKVVNIADVVVLNKWLNDAKSYNITDQGKVNADCCDEKGGAGLDKNDSDAIIKSIVHLVELPCKAADLK